MKKRITCMLLVLCMVLAAVPTALAGQAVEDQIDFSLLKKHQANETQTLQVESVQKLQEEAMEPMDARASGYATYVPHSSSLEQYRMVGDKMHLEAIAYVPDASVKQDWNLELYAGAEPTEKGYVGSSWGTFDSGAGYYTISIDVDPAKLKAGTYTVVYFSSYDISDDEFQVVEDTVVLHHVYVTKNAVLMTRSFFADAGQSDYPEVTKICVARGFQDVTNYFLRFGPENTTDNRFASFTTSNSDMLEVDDFAGFLTLNAKQYGVATVSVGNIRKDFTISVEICTDDKGHDYNKEVVNPQPTCTEEGRSSIVCTKCGHVKSSSTIPALGHAWDDGRITKEETEEAWGEKLYTCTRCGETKTAPYHTCPGAIFTDMPKDDNWSHKGIDYCLKNKLMNGMENNRFQPFTNTTRAQIVTVLWRMAGSPEPESAAPFADLKQGSFYEKAVAWGHEQGIVNGITETEFYPNSSVTREQMAAFFYRYAENILKADVSARKEIESFPDYDKTAGYSKECLSWAYSVGLINGVSNGSVTYLQPKSGATRAQISTVLMRFCENIVPAAPETPEA